ncbi:hypothetical protein EDB85DRAFT_2279952, partial [Lactarius pseudohatsudake]
MYFSLSKSRGSKKGATRLCRVPPLVVLTLPFVNRGRYSFRFAHRGSTCMRAAPVRKAEGGAPPPICAARSRTTRPARPRSAYTEEGGASALAREPAGERGGLLRGRPLAFCPGAQTGGKGGGGALPGVCPFAFGSSARALGSLAPVSWKGRRFCAFRFARCLCARTRGRTPTWSARPRSRGVRARKRGRGAGVWGARPFSSPRADPSFACGLCAQTGGGRRAASGIARAVPGKRGKGGGGAYLVPRRPSCSRVNEGEGGQRRGTYLSRAPCSCAPPPLARKRERRCSGGGLSRVCVSCSRVNEGGGGWPSRPRRAQTRVACHFLRSPPFANQRGRGRCSGLLSRCSFARIRGQGQEGARTLQGRGGACARVRGRERGAKGGGGG